MPNVNLSNDEPDALAHPPPLSKAERLCKSNPCVGVRRNKTKARTRYVRDDEYLLYFSAAPITCRTCSLGST
jgi:hypothetical protein